MKAILVHLDVKLRCFAHGQLDTANFIYLTSNVKMDKTKTILHFVFIEIIKRLEQFAGSQSKLAAIATRVFPFAASGTG